MLFYLQKIIKWFVFSNLWIALCAVALTLQTYILLGVEPNNWLLLFVFCSTLSAYTLQRLLKSETLPKKSIRHLWLDQHQKTSYALLFLALSFGIFSLIMLPAKIIYMALPLGFISLLYAGNFLKKLKLPYENLRSVPMIKIFLISGSWVVTTVGLPLFLLPDFPENSIYLFLLNFGLITAVTIPFDIRDIDVDLSFQKTLPQLLGIKLSKLISAFIIVICTLMTSVVFELYLFFPISSIFTIVCIKMTHSSRNELFFTGIMDGNILLIALSGMADVLLFQ